MSDITRVSTLINQIKAFFRLSKDGNISGVKISKSDINASVAPDNIVTGNGVKRIVVSETPPSSPQTGDIWIDIS